MRTIERRFIKIKRNNENWSDYVCLAEAVRGQQFTRRKIYTYFKKLVSKDDYDEADSNALVRYLCHVSKAADECTFLMKNAPEHAITDEDEANIIRLSFLPRLLENEQTLI